MERREESEFGGGGWDKMQGKGENVKRRKKEKHTWVVEENEETSSYSGGVD